MTNETCKVLEHEDIGAGYRRIVFAAPGVSATAEPGQFVHVKVPGLEESALRRPFSIFNAEDGRLELLYKTVGRGTAAMNPLVPGDEVCVMGPLGHGFPKKCAGAPLLVGGGFGVAPLYFLARVLKGAGLAPKLFVGGRTKADLLALHRFASDQKSCRSVCPFRRERGAGRWREVFPAVDWLQAVVRPGLRSRGGEPRGGAVCGASALAAYDHPDPRK